MSTSHSNDLPVLVPVPVAVFGRSVRGALDSHYCPFVCVQREDRRQQLYLGVVIYDSDEFEEQKDLQQRVGREAGSKLTPFINVTYIASSAIVAQFGYLFPAHNDVQFR